MNSENINKYKSSLPKIANRTTMGFHPMQRYYSTEPAYISNIKGNNKNNMYQYQLNIKNKKKKNQKI